MKYKLSKLLGLFTYVLICIFLTVSCASESKLDYYMCVENYIEVRGIVEHISYDDRSGAIYVDLSDMNPQLDDTCFKIVGENAILIQENGIHEVLKHGCEISIITAPKYFGDGYVMPIVALSIGEVNYLDFSDGYANYIKWLELGR